MFERQINRQLNSQRTRIDKQNHEAKRRGYQKIQNKEARKMRKRMRFGDMSNTHAKRFNSNNKSYPTGI